MPSQTAAGCAAAWLRAGRTAHLPHPLTGLVVGDVLHPHEVDAARVQQLGQPRRVGVSDGARQDLVAWWVGWCGAAGSGAARRTWGVGAPMPAVRQRRRGRPGAAGRDAAARPPPRAPAWLRTDDHERRPGRRRGGRHAAPRRVGGRAAAAARAARRAAAAQAAAGTAAAQWAGSRQQVAVQPQAQLHFTACAGRCGACGGDAGSDGRGGAGFGGLAAARVSAGRVCIRSQQRRRPPQRRHRARGRRRAAAPAARRSRRRQRAAAPCARPSAAARGRMRALLGEVPAPRAWCAPAAQPGGGKQQASPPPRSNTPPGPRPCGPRARRGRRTCALAFLRTQPATAAAAAARRRRACAPRPQARAGGLPSRRAPRLPRRAAAPVPPAARGPGRAPARHRVRGPAWGGRQAPGAGRAGRARAQGG
jgi:hypothetical protein